MKRVMSAIILVAFYMTDHTFAQDNWEATHEMPESMQQEFAKKRHQAEMIRRTYDDSDVPNGVVFQSLIGRIFSRYGGNDERTVEKVKHAMEFVSDEEALTFIQLIDEVNRALTKTQLQSRQSKMCQLDAEKSAQDMFRDIDELTDFKMASAEQSYRNFLQSLGDQNAELFSAWVERTKGGFQYTIFKAEAILEEKGEHPFAYYQIECSRTLQKLGADK